MIRRYLILSVLSLFLFSGCALNVQPQQSPEMLKAEALIQEGKNQEAAAIYKELAAAVSTQQDAYRLLAADALIRANDITHAAEYLALIDASALNQTQLNHLNLLQAQLKLNYGNAEQALSQLKTVQSESFNPQTKIAYYQTLAFAYSLTGDAVQSAQALINADSFINTPKMRAQNYERILSTLSVLPENALFLNQPVGNTMLNGWMSLARVFKLGNAALAENLTKWRKTYAAHPANSLFLVEYLKNHQLDAAHASIIGVLLPESGVFAAPATVIKKGFLKAYHLAKKQGSTHFEVRFYDTSKNSSAQLYKNALNDGAQLIVGPLDKKDIKELVSGSDLTVPVLALNQVEGLTHPKLYQFALNPADDAAQITLKAHQDGYQNAVFLAPKTEHGKRFSGYLTEKWEAAGGKTVSVETYNDTATDFSKLVKQLLKQQEANEVDALIINAYPKPARVLLSQLHKSKTAVTLPIYASSQIYLGDVDASRDKALNEVTFCDVPWVFSQAYTGELSKAALHESWETLSPIHLRLLPMGIDAYYLTEQLTQLKTKPFSGASGQLKLDKDNHITRELLCARFENGVAKVIGFEDKSAETTPSKNLPTLPDLPKLESKAK